MKFKKVVKLPIMTRGWVVTSNVTGSPTPGQVAYADAVTKGNVSTIATTAQASGNLAIGRLDVHTRTQTVTLNSTSTFLTTALAELLI